jgi:hypothetical protein
VHARAGLGRAGAGHVEREGPFFQVQVPAPDGDAAPRVGASGAIAAASLEGSEDTFRPESFEGLEIALARLWG